MVDYDIQVSLDGKTIWVHSADGSTVGRFSVRFGMDVHTTVTEQLNGATQCLFCTHTTPNKQDWITFCNLMLRHYDIKIPRRLIKL